MNSLQKQRLLSYYTSQLFRKGKPTINRVQNLIIQQKIHRKLDATHRPPKFNSSTERWLYYFRQGVSLRWQALRGRTSVLFASRWFRVMMSIPMMYLCFLVGKQIQIEQINSQQPAYYIKSATPIKDQLKGYTASVIGEVLNDKRVEAEGLNFLARLFTDP